MRRKDREINDENIIRDILNRSDVCRLGFVDNGIAYIVALNFGVEFSDPIKLYFHCAPKGRKIGLIEKNPVTCFQFDIDHDLQPGGDIACNWSMNYKSIVGYGKVNFIEEAASKQKALDNIMNHYNSQKKDNYEYPDKDIKTTTVFELVVDTLSCKMRQG